MAVGTNCCDNLTGTNEATQHRKLLNRKKRFIESSRWKYTLRGILIKPYNYLVVEVIKDENNYKIHMNYVKGKKAFATEIDAKEFVFDQIENGKAKKFALNNPLDSTYA